MEVLMKRLTLILSALLLVSTISAQQILRSEFSVYDTRENAIKAVHTEDEKHIRFAPKLATVVDGVEVLEQKFNMPTAWSDYNIYLHIQNSVKAFDLVINEQLIECIEDSYTPVDFDITPFLRQGDNDIMILARASTTNILNPTTIKSSAAPFHGSYIFAQHRKHIYDYDARIRQVGKSLKLELDIILRNNFNFEESMQVGYDIYSPDKKLVDYAVREVSVPGRGVDTLRIRTSLGEESRFLWSNGNPHLYRITLYTRRDGAPREYITLRIGAGSTTFADGKILRNGTPITIKSAPFNANGSYAEVLAEIKALRSKGINTLTPSTPQPYWFYNICDGLGIYVIEQANINPVTESLNRNIGGTPSNNFELLQDYMARTRAMYYRTRNHSCIIAYSLGGEKAGNGYNMYKVYQWLKSVEKERAVICQSADGEWNSDIVNF